MYSVEIIIKNGFNCNWATFFIGRKYKLISTIDVTNYAVRYIENNPAVNDNNILELAWENDEEKVDEILGEIIADNSLEILNKEYHKWLFSLVEEVYSKSTEENIFIEIETIFYLFNTPPEMHDFFRKVSDAYHYPTDSQQNIKEVIEEFLTIEKQLILN